MRSIALLEKILGSYDKNSYSLPTGFSPLQANGTCDHLKSSHTVHQLLDIINTTIFQIPEEIMGNSGGAAETA